MTVIMARIKPPEGMEDSVRIYFRTLNDHGKMHFKPLGWFAFRPGEMSLVKLDLDTRIFTIG